MAADPNLKCLQVLEDGGRYRIRTYDFHRVKVAMCFESENYGECSGALRNAQEHIFQHGPERWTHKWTHVKPGWHPVFFRLVLHLKVEIAGMASSPSELG
jgi:hypothetical protein